MARRSRGVAAALAALTVCAAAAPPAPPPALEVYWSAKFTDNFVGTSSAAAGLDASYQYVTGDLFALPAPSAGLVPLNLYARVNATSSHHWTTASEAGNAAALAAGFTLVGVQGYVFAAAPADGSGLPLELWYSAQRDDHFLVGTAENRANAQGAGYSLLYVDCWTSPAWVSWPSQPPAGVPFAASTDLVGFDYLVGKNAVTPGIHADTWYPSWAADGNLYSSWTDGQVDGVTSCSGCGDHATTGYAIISGDDPFNLTLTGVATYVEPVAPYQGRYPSLNFRLNGTWYFGTYSLENYGAWPTPGPDCSNWCIQGPFTEIRTSRDNGATWTAPRRNMTGWADNLFGESAFNNSKVKLGAPHAVDHGRENEHSPDGALYMVGHGAETPESYQSWMDGDSVYMARTRGPPDAATINDAASWEFYAGGAGPSAVWAPTLAAARPLFVWPRRTGVVTLSYHAALGKYVLVVSTPTIAPSTEGTFDTYYLESDSLTGPWGLIAYTPAFGQQAYFVHIPSKFMGGVTQAPPPVARAVTAPLAADARAPIVAPLRGDDAAAPPASLSYYDFFLSYSANFAGSVKANPPGSGYHWSLQHARFGITPAFAARLRARGAGARGA